MSANSRLDIDPSTLLPSIQNFGELSQFLREAVADEDSMQLGESMGTLASHIEAVVAQLRLARHRAVVAPMLMDLLTVLRIHHGAVVGLNPSWRGLYEYASYLAALNNFRVLIGQWLLDGGRHGEVLGIAAEDVELVAWRTLGEGMLLIDMYEQWRRDEGAHEPTTSSNNSRTAEADTVPSALVGNGSDGSADPRIQRAMRWWSKLRL
jgi:hypothetical protein